MFKSLQKYFFIRTNILLICISFCIILNTACSRDKSIYRQTHYFELFSDGYALHTSESSYKNTSKEAIEIHSFINSSNTIDKVLDEKGNELPLDVRKEKSYFRYTVQLIEPVQTGEEFILKYVSKKIKMAKKQDSKWIYNRFHIPIPETDYSETVKLPSGAELISVEPKPTEKSVENGSLVLLFKKHLQKDEAFKCRIEYKLNDVNG